MKDFLIEEGRFRELIRFFKIRACIGNDETTVVGHLANDKFNLTSPSGREFKRRFIRFHRVGFDDGNAQIAIKYTLAEGVDMDGELIRP